MMTRWSSEPLRHLLDQSHVAPEDLYASLDALAGRLNVARLYPGHALLDDLRRATGVNVVEVGRRHRRLLVKIEELTKRKPGWAYREASLHKCVFSCPGVVPEVRKALLLGHPLSRLVDAHPALNDIRIKDITNSADGWSEVRLDPDWVTF